MTTSQLIDVISTTANTLRGMMTDPFIPDDTRGAIRDLVMHLDVAESELLEENPDDI